LDRANAAKLGLRHEAVKEIRKMRHQLIHLIKSAPLLKTEVEKYLSSGEELTDELSDSKTSQEQLCAIR
jgi:hypothetical protein